MKPLKQNSRVGWRDSAQDYQRLITDKARDSKFLRERGLLPGLIDMIGDCAHAKLLDAGTGAGWLFRHVHPGVAHACDIVTPDTLPEYVEFRQEPIHSLSYADGEFDIVVASLVLMFCADLPAVCRELRRVAKSDDGKLVIALTHPYFYRTGSVTAAGNFSLKRDLSKAARSKLKIGNLVGPFDYYYRPFPDYLNALTQAGWGIEQVRDWFVDIEEYVQANVSTKVKRTGRVPMYSFIKCYCR